MVCGSTNKEDYEDLDKKLRKIEGALVANFLNENKEIERLKSEVEHYKLLYANNGIDKLQRIYDSELNIALSWFWDGGIDVVIGDKLNGIKESANFKNVSEAVDWLEVRSKAYLVNATN